MRCSRHDLWIAFGLAAGIAVLGSCGSSHNNKTDDTTTKATPAPAPPRDAGSMTITSDDEFIANGREIVRRLVEIFTNDGQDCERLAADVSRLSMDPIWAASTRYEDAHPDVRTRFRDEHAEMGKRFAAVARPAATACADNEAFKSAFAKMR